MSMILDIQRVAWIVYIIMYGFGVTSDFPAAQRLRRRHPTPGVPEELDLPIHLQLKWKPRYTLPRLKKSGKMSSDQKSDKRTNTPNVCTSAFPHFPSSTKNSLATVSWDGAWVINAFSNLCAGMLNTDDSAPIRLGIPRGGCAVHLSSWSISSKSAKG